MLVFTPVSPNAVSIASILVGVAGALLLAQGTASAAIWGAVLFQFSAVLDCVDGDLARVVFKESPVGKWLDLAGDQVVHAAVFAGIAVGLARAGSSAPVFWLGLSAVLGGLIAFAVVVRGMRHNSGDSALRQLIDRMTNRDFSVLVIALAALELLESFLWMAAIGSHFFWLTALWLQLKSRRPTSAAA
jgi:phosphatidylglycerophosphate synthase